MIELIEEQFQASAAAVIKVLGIGGAGGNTVNSIVNSGYSSIDSIVANTDSQVLSLSKANHVIHIGVKSAKGLGAGANPDLGQRAAQEDLDKIMLAVKDADIVFLTAGMGGGTGSGALPVVARALREKGILCIAIVTKPFAFEGKRRCMIAENAIEALRKEVDTLIVIPNQKLLDVVDQQVSMIDAFAMINDILSNSVKGISDIITKPGHINVDFADVRTIMKDMGLAVMGTGVALGKDRAQQAALQAISSPLLENMSIKGARGVLLNITGGKNLGLHEISQAASIIYDQAHEDATIILGSVIDEQMGDEVSVTIIATGFEHPCKEATDVAMIKTESKVIASVRDISLASLESDSKDEKKEDVKVCQSSEENQAQQEASDETGKRQRPAEKPVEAISSTSLKDNEIDMNDLDVPAFLRKNAHPDN